MLAEWLKSTVPFGGFPWGVVGFSQDDSPLLAIAHFGGAPLVSFAVALVGFSLGAIVHRGACAWWRTAPPRAAAAPARGRAARRRASSLVLLDRRAGHPVRPHSRRRVRATTRPSTVAAVQGNVPRLGLEFNAQRRAVLDNHVRETLRLAEDVRAGRAPQPAVVIWPENSSDIDPIANRDAADQIAVGRRRDPRADPGRRRRRGPRLHPGEPGGDQHGDRLGRRRADPASATTRRSCSRSASTCRGASFFRHLSSFADRAGYFVPGDGNGVVHAAGIPIGVTTCWEVIFDRAARESVLNGAQFLAVPTNNATFDESMSAQQLAFARLRAVEHDRYVVVAGTVGHQRGHRARRARAGPHRVLRAGLPRRSDPAEDRTSRRPRGGVRSSRDCSSSLVLRLVVAAMLHNGGSRGSSRGDRDEARRPTKEST